MLELGVIGVTGTDAGEVVALNSLDLFLLLFAFEYKECG